MKVLDKTIQAAIVRRDSSADSMDKAIRRFMSLDRRIRHNPDDIRVMIRDVTILSNRIADAETAITIANHVAENSGTGDLVDACEAVLTESLSWEFPEQTLEQVRRAVAKHKGEEK